ncbi:hypothetical protein LCGC14_1369610 [marine sediment metagenome]|uniref:Uncharacterized protein n=1 Tax=marine sediment metagenome TaxID=412755 RepID=A0A0F9K665_9ZZZZ
MTKGELTKLITEQMESTEKRDLVEAWAKANAGKQIRKNNLPEGARLTREYWISLHFGEYDSKWGDYREKFTLSHRSTRGVVPFVNNLHEMNPCFYTGVDKRNAYRRQLLSNSGEMAGLVNAVNDVKAAVKNYRTALSQLEALAGYPNPETYELREIAEVIEEKK